MCLNMYVYICVYLFVFFSFSSYRVYATLTHLSFHFADYGLICHLHCAKCMPNTLKLTLNFRFVLPFIYMRIKPSRECSTSYSFYFTFSRASHFSAQTKTRCECVCVCVCARASNITYVSCAFNKLNKTE